jgi:hypothetical protein
MKPRWIEKAKHYRFAIMIGGAVALSLILTTISITIYIASGAINIDLSRPDYETVRENVESAEEAVPFSPTGPIDRSVIDDFNRRLNNIRAEIDQMNDFSPEDLSDAALDLVPNE